MVEFYLLTFPRFPLRKKEHKSYLGKNRTHDFRTSRCAAYLLDHSGDELPMYNENVQQNPLCVESCVTKKFSMSPTFSSAIFDPDASSVLLTFVQQ